MNERPTNRQIAAMTQDERRDETWRSFADHVLDECRERGAQLVVLGNAKPMFVEIRDDSLFAWPADPDDWAAGVAEPVAALTSRDFLGTWFEHARLVRVDEDADEVVREMKARRAGREAVASAVPKATPCARCGADTGDADESYCGNDCALDHAHELRGEVVELRAAAMFDWDELAHVQALNHATGYVSGVAAAFGYDDRYNVGPDWPEAWEQAFNVLADATEQARRAELWWSHAGPGEQNAEFVGVAKDARALVDRLKRQFVELMRPDTHALLVAELQDAVRNVDRFEQAVESPEACGDHDPIPSAVSSARIARGRWVALIERVTGSKP